MPRYNHIVNAFTSGEISPKLYGRTDMDQYKTGLATMQNMIALTGGGATRRPGTRYVTTVASAGSVRLVPFSYSVSESYIMEISDHTIRAINGNTHVITNLSCVGSFTPDMGNFYSQADLADIQYTQSADVLYLVHPNYPPLKISRTGTNSFLVTTFQDKSFGPAGVPEWAAVPYLLQNTDTTNTLTASATTGTITLTSSSFMFNVNHVNAFFRISSGGSTGVVQITSFINTGVVNAYVNLTLPTTAACYAWEEAAWSAYRGYPRAVCFFESRLYFGGNQSKPDTLWGSRQYNYYWMMAPKLAQDLGADASGLKYFGAISNADAISFALSSQQVNVIQWLSGDKTLTVGTLGSEHLVSGPDQSQGLGALNIQANLESTHGSIHAQARKNSYTLLFLQRSGRKLLELYYDLYASSYKAQDLTLTAEHMPRRSAQTRRVLDYPLLYTTQQITEIHRQDTPNQVVWCLDSTGGTFAVTRDRDIQVNAWHYHILGGSFTPAGATVPEPPLVRSMAVISSSNGINDDVWFAVTRVINGAFVTTLEYMAKDFEASNFTDEDPYYVDCGKVLTSGSPTTAYTGLSHLVGQTVTLLADGFSHPDVVVAAGGGITLNFAASKVIVGLKYQPVIKTLEADVGAAIGSSLGSIGRIDRCVVKFYNSIGCKVGSAMTPGAYEELNFRPSNTPMNAPTPLFTGDKIVDFPASPDRNPSVTIWSDQPFPLTVVSITTRGDTRDQ